MRLEIQGVRVFPKFDNPKTLQGIPMESYKEETNVSKLSVIKTMVETSLGQFSIITIENNITKYL